MLFIIFLIFITFSEAGRFHLTENDAVPTKDELVLLIMGDPQYHYPCEMTNLECKAASQPIRKNFRLDYFLRPLPPILTNWTEAQDEAIKVESRFANKIQRNSLEKLIRSFPYEPSALIINGDLTNFGHKPQLDEFVKGWMTKFPIPILAGLGNHDCQNNVDDCFANYCVDNMMDWYIKYAKNHSLDVDYTKDEKMVHEGTFAYSKRLCSLTGKNCAYVLQLNNALDYERNITFAWAEKWRIKSTVSWLKRQLDLLADFNLPILINVHQSEGVRMVKMRELLSDWILSLPPHFKRPRIAVLFAHMHGKHEVRNYCLHGVTVPFSYVGSVPNQRFSMLRIGSEKSDFYGFASSVIGGPRVLDKIEDIWPSDECSSTSSHHFQMPLTAQRQP